MDLSILNTTAVAFGLILTRVSSFVVAGPMFGTGIVPNTVKLGVCIVLSLFLLPHYEDYVVGLNSTPQLVLATAAEALVGLGLGYWLRIVFLPISIAGTYLGQELGFNLGQITSSTSGAATNETGFLFDSLALALFWVTDAHHRSLKVLSYTTLVGPDGSSLEMPSPFDISSLICEAHHFGLGIVSPLATILFVSLIGLMLLMRAWPHINLFSFGSAARLAVGWVALTMFGPMVIANIAFVMRTGILSMDHAVMGP